MSGDMNVWGWWMMALMPVMWLGLPALIVWAISAARRSRDANADRLGLLRQRYARGETTREQFEQSREGLAPTGG